MKKKIYILVIFILICAGLVYMNYKNVLNENKIITCKESDPNDKLYLVYTKDSFKEFVTKDNELVIKVKYELISNFDQNGLAIVYDNGKSDLMDRSCHIKNNFSYTNITRISGFYLAKKNNQVYVINKNNDVLYIWTNYNTINFTSTPSYLVSSVIDGKSMKYGLYKIDNENIFELIPPTYDFIFQVPNTGTGLVSAYENADHAGYIDSNGKLLEFDEIYDKYSLLYYGNDFVRKGTKWALLKDNGDLITDFIYDDVVGFLSKNEAIVKKGKKLALINTNGDFITDYAYEDIKRDGEFFRIKQNNLWGYLGPDYEKITECIYDEVYGFTDGYAQVKRNEKFGFINQDGVEVVEAKYDNLLNATYIQVETIEHKRSRTIIASINNKFGIIDFNNHILVDIKYDKISAIAYNYAIVSSNNRFGVINFLTGEFAIDLKYKNITYLENGNYELVDEHSQESTITLDYVYPLENKNVQIYSHNKKIGLETLSGEKITDALYDPIYKQLDDGLLVIKDGKIGKVDFNGQLVTPFIYDNISFVYKKMNINQPYFFVQENGKWGIMNYNNQYIKEPSYDEIEVSTLFNLDTQINYVSIYQEYLTVKLNGKYGLINLKTFEEIIPPIYDDIDVQEDHNVIRVEHNNKYGLYDLNGKEILPVQFGLLSLG